MWPEDAKNDTLNTGWPLFQQKQTQQLFKDFQASSPPFSNLFHRTHSFYVIKSVSNTDVHPIAYSSPMTASFYYMTRITG